MPWSSWSSKYRRNLPYTPLPDRYVYLTSKISASAALLISDWCEKISQSADVWSTVMSFCLLSARLSVFTLLPSSNNALRLRLYKSQYCSVFNSSMIDVKKFTSRCDAPAVRGPVDYIQIQIRIRRDSWTCEFNRRGLHTAAQRDITVQSRRRRVLGMGNRALTSSENLGENQVSPLYVFRDAHVVSRRRSLPCETFQLTSDIIRLPLAATPTLVVRPHLSRRPKGQHLPIATDRFLLLLLACCTCLERSSLRAVGLL